QQVDIREGVQLAAPGAADRQQGNVVGLAPGKALPGVGQQLDDEPGTLMDQPANVALAAEALIQHAACLLDGFLEGRNRAALERELCLKLAGVEQLRIGVRHATSSGWA